MAGPTVGWAEIKVDFDGSTLDEQAARLSEKAGKRAGFSYTEGFDKGLSDFGSNLAKRMEKNGKLGAESLGKSVKKAIRGDLKQLENQIAHALASQEGFERFAKNMGGSAAAVDRLNESLTRAAAHGQINRREFEDMKVSLDEWSWALYQTEVAQEQAAAAAAAHAAENDRLNNSLKDVQLTLGSRKNFEALVKNAQNSSEALRDLEFQMLDLVTAGRISETQFDLFNSRIQEYSTEVVKASTSTEKLERELEKQSRLLQAASKGIDKVGSSWRRMDGTVRLVLTLIASGATDIAALGSAAGAGVVTLGAALGQLVAGAVGVGVVFNRLGQDIEDLAPSMRNVAQEFDAFKDTAGEAADVIASAAFAEMDEVFDGLGDTIKNLYPSLSKLGTSVGKAFKEFQTAFETGSDGFKELDRFVSNAAGGFEELAGIITNLFVALLRGFNEADPLLQDFYEWLSRIVLQFDAFTRSTAFDQWIRNAQDVFGAFGELLDTTGQSLNDLSNNESIGRLVAMIDDLAAAIPPLFDALNVISILDPLGLLVQAISDLLVAVDPLVVALGPLAAVFNELASSAISVVAAAVGVFAQAMAGLVSVIPPELLASLITGLLLFKTVDQIVPALTKAGAAIYDFGVNLYTMPDKVGKLKSLGKGLGLAVLFQGLSSAMAGVNKETELTVAQLAKVGAAFTNSADSFTGFRDQLTGSARAALDSGTLLKGMYSDNFWESLRPSKGVTDAIDGLTLGMTDLSAEFNTNQAVFTAWGEELATLASSDLPAATSSFKELVDGFGGGDEVIKQLLSAMLEYSAQLTETAEAAGLTLSEQELLNAAVGKMPPEMKEAASAADDQAKALADLQGKADDTSGAIEDLSDKIHNFGSAQFDVNDASRSFEAALDDLTESLEDNGSTMDISTEAGRQNSAALDDIAKSALDYSSALLTQTGDQQAATDAIQKGRDAVIAAAEQLGLSEEAAAAYADSLGLIPENVDTASDFAPDPDVGTYDKAVRNVPPLSETQSYFYKDKALNEYDLAVRNVPPFSKTQSYFYKNNDMPNYDKAVRNIPPFSKTQAYFYEDPAAASYKRTVDDIPRYVSTSVELTFTATNGNTVSYDDVFTRRASGGIVNGPERALIGEAGPEAVVPLRRPLSMVDPAVRGLSAIAQGITDGGQSLATRSVLVQPGAIQINGALHPEQVAIRTVDRLAERIVG